MAFDIRTYEFVQNVVNGDKLWVAYQKAYGASEESSKSSATRLMKTDKVKDLLQSVLAEGGMKLEEFNRRLATKARTGATDAVQLRALDMIGKSLGAYTENLNVKGTLSWKQFIEGDGSTDVDA